MNVKNFLRQMLLGSSLPNEYVCTPSDLPASMQVILESNLGEVDVTGSHVLLGYKPVLIGLLFHDPQWVAWAAKTKEIKISFRTSAPNNELAWLKLKKAGSWRMGDTTFVIYQGISGNHGFMGPWRRLTNGIYERLRSHKPGNVTLTRNLYSQVRIAYSVPRKISRIVLGDGSAYNIFPSDLHGPIGMNFYAGSLRIGSNASRQVEQLKRILVADMDVSTYRETYALGRNHMSNLQPLAILPSCVDRSERWQLPVPSQATGYKELLWKHSWDAGIHRVHFYEVVGEKLMDGRVPSLCHIHAYYAQWRLNNHLDSSYFFR